MPTTERKTYVEHLHNLLEAWDARLEKLQSEAAEAGGELQRTIEREANALGARRDAFSVRLQRLETAPGDAWREMRDGLDQAWRDLDAALRRTRERIQQKV